MGSSESVPEPSTTNNSSNITECSSDYVSITTDNKTEYESIYLEDDDYYDNLDYDKDSTISFSTWAELEDKVPPLPTIFITTPLRQSLRFKRPDTPPLRTPRPLRFKRIAPPPLILHIQPSPALARPETPPRSVAMGSSASIVPSTTNNPSNISECSSDYISIITDNKTEYGSICPEDDNYNGNLDVDIDSSTSFSSWEECEDKVRSLPTIFIPRKQYLRSNRPDSPPLRSLRPLRFKRATPPPLVLHNQPFPTLARSVTPPRSMCSKFVDIFCYFRRREK